jgi:hypothetical protein
MQGMGRKNNGHVWCKVITTNIKNNFGHSFKKACCVGQLHCVHDFVSTLYVLPFITKPSSTYILVIV